ncbi:MAG TPA: GTP cyclohydrolase FolE2 [Casimicrobiaceae bacterium]|nr:GTP cyclohydrolase FolE2 [Casimicrobiaceae bacterium]
MNRPESPAIPDVHSHRDARALAIDRVGIRGLRYPIRFADGRAPAQPTIASCNLSVALRAEQKGTHMSRLVAAIDGLRDPLTVASLPALLDELLSRLEASSARIEIDFPWFRRKAAPVSGVESMMDYEAKLFAEAADGKRRLDVSVAVPVMSLCPSSKAIADYGAHNQRSHLTVSVGLRDAASITLEELVTIAEEEASCELYGILKRADEKYVTERAYERPRFVEDLVRGIAARLVDDARFEGFRVEAENFESIHNHSAYARIERGR